jgi:predicted DNA-binding transcriptional regulator AlpA
MELIVISKEDLNLMVTEIIRSELTRISLQPPERILSLVAAARILGISRSLIFQWRKEGFLPNRKIGKRVFVVESEILETIKNLPRHYKP